MVEVETVSLDEDDDDNITTPRQFSAEGDDFIFTDSADIESNAEIIGFGIGDRIQVDVDTSLYSFTTVNDGSSDEFDDLIITLNNDGVVSQIILQDVIEAGTFVFDEASAEEAFGEDFFVDGPPAPPPPPPPPPPPTGTDGVVDADEDSDTQLNTPTIFDAGEEALTFTDDADVESNYVIQNASADDVIVFLNADPSDFSYTSVGTDLVVSFTKDGVVNSIVIEDAVSEDAFIETEADAEQALGDSFNNGIPLDFFQAG